MTAIATVDDHHCLFHTVDENDGQKPAVVVHHQWQQWRSSSMEAAADGGRSDDGLRQQQSLSMEGVVGWRDNDAIALATMASLADGGGGNGGRCCQLCNGG